MSLLDIMLGKPLAYSEERAEKIGTLTYFGPRCTGLGSLRPEAALTLLLPLVISPEALKVLDQQLHLIFFDPHGLHSAECHFFCWTAQKRFQFLGVILAPDSDELRAGGSSDSIVPVAGIAPFFFENRFSFGCLRISQCHILCNQRSAGELGLEFRFHELNCVFMLSFQLCCHPGIAHVFAMTGKAEPAQA